MPGTSSEPPLKRADARRSQRVLLRIPIQVKGLPEDGIPITEDTTTVEVNAHGARVLRVLGQAYVRRGDWRSGRECLEQLRAVQREQKLLSSQHYAVALNDLLRCYTQLALEELAQGVRQEAGERRT